MNPKEFQQFQDEFDAAYYEHRGEELKDIRHMTLHIGKLLGKLSTYVEKAEHGSQSDTQQLKEEVVPDLLFWALHMANLYSVDIEEQYKKRIDANRNRIDNQMV